MNKTQTKKDASAKKKSPATAKKAAAKKVPDTKKTGVSLAQKKPTTKTAPVAPKKAATPPVVSTPPTPKIQKKPQPASQAATPSAKEGVKMLGILHLIGNLVSGGTLGIILVVAYLLIRKNELSPLEKETCYEIINFNLSFLLYALIATAAIIIVIGIILLPVVAVTGLVLMILGFMRHLLGENYRYPLIIRFIS